MNWYSLVAAGVAGGLASLLAMLLVPRRAERQITFVIVLVLLFSVFNAAAKYFVVPALTLPHAMDKAERELSAMPVFQAIKQHDRATYDGLMAELEQGLRQGKSEAAMIATLRPGIEQMVQRRVALASDEAVIAYMSVFTREMRALERKDASACMRFLFPQQRGAIVPREYLPQSLIDADMIALTQVIKSSAEHPQPVPREADVDADLQLVIAELEDKHPADVALLQQLQSPTVDDAKACAVVASFYETILQLPPDSSGKLLRYFLSQG